MALRVSSRVGQRGAPRRGQERGLGWTPCLPPAGPIMARSAKRAATSGLDASGSTCSPCASRGGRRAHSAGGAVPLGAPSRWGRRPAGDARPWPWTRPSSLNWSTGTGRPRIEHLVPALWQKGRGFRHRSSSDAPAAQCHARRRPPFLGGGPGAGGEAVL